MNKIHLLSTGRSINSVFKLVNAYSSRLLCIHMTMHLQQDLLLVQIQKYRVHAIGVSQYCDIPIPGSNSDSKFHGTCKITF